MRTLGDAWSWYEKNRLLVRLMGRLGGLHWEKMPWEELEKDDHFRDVEGGELDKKSAEVLAELDDIAVIVLFSVFEANIREHVLDDVKEEIAALTHPALLRMAARMKENIEEGGFYSNVLDLFKGLDHELVEQVSQIRKYRNWVAHGRRPGKKPFNTTPKDALDRLEAFLSLIGSDREP